MGISALPGLELTLPAQGSERLLEEMLECVSVDLRLAEGSAKERSAEDAFDIVEQAFRTDPCRFLRGACQVADYGEEGAPSRLPDGARDVSRQ